MESSAPRLPLVAKLKLNSVTRATLQAELQLRKVSLNDLVSQFVESELAQTRALAIPANFLSMNVGDERCACENYRRMRTRPNERTRQEIVGHILAGQMNVPEASRRFSVSTSAIRRLLKNYAAVNE